MISKGAEKLGQILAEIFPGYVIKSEVPIKIGRQTLFVDFMIPSLNLAFEYDGIQHFKKISFFTATNHQFNVLKGRDAQKAHALSDLDYTLIRIKYNEELTTESLRERIKEAIEG